VGDTLPLEDGRESAFSSSSTLLPRERDRDSSEAVRERESTTALFLLPLRVCIVKIRKKNKLKTEGIERVNE
jgi:hypothetical protein